MKTYFFLDTILHFWYYINIKNVSVCRRLHRCTRVRIRKGLPHQNKLIPPSGGANLFWWSISDPCRWFPKNPQDFCHVLPYKLLWLLIQKSIVYIFFKYCIARRWGHNRFESGMLHQTKSHFWFYWECDFFVVFK